MAARPYPSILLALAFAAGAAFAPCAPACGDALQVKQPRLQSQHEGFEAGSQALPPTITAPSIKTAVKFRPAQNKSARPSHTPQPSPIPASTSPVLTATTRVFKVAAQPKPAQADGLA